MNQNILCEPAVYPVYPVCHRLSLFSIINSFTLVTEYFVIVSISLVLYCWLLLVAVAAWLGLKF